MPKRFLKRALPILALAMLLLVPLATHADYNQDIQLLNQIKVQDPADPSKEISVDNPQAFNTPATAAGGMFTGVTVACWYRGTCSFCDGMIVFINVANAILRLLAIVAVVFFIYGSGLLMMSNGNEDMVHKGKATLKATIVGTIIVLFAWQGMALTVYVLANQNPNKPSPTGNVDTTPGLRDILNWYNVANTCRTGEPAQSNTNGTGAGGTFDGGGSGGTIPGPDQPAPAK